MTTPRTTELIPSEAMENIVHFDVQLDAASIEKYVATKFRGHYQKAMREALDTRAKRAEEVEKLNDEAEKLVKDDAEKRLKSKIDALKKGYQPFGAMLKVKIETSLTSQEEGESRRKDTVYGTYCATVGYTVTQGKADDDEESKRYRSIHSQHTSELHVDLKYPARATVLLKNRDEANKAANRAQAVAEELKREEATAIATARDKVGGMLVENRMRAVEGGEKLVEALDNLTADLIGDVDERLKLRLELK